MCERERELREREREREREKITFFLLHTLCRERETTTFFYNSIEYTVCV